jgi:hypothetical protein
MILHLSEGKDSRARALSGPAESPRRPLGDLISARESDLPVVVIDGVPRYGLAKYLDKLVEGPLKGSSHPLWC